MKSAKKKSWSAVACWAIGCGYQKGRIYQILFDCLVRNVDFWESYSKLLKVKYIFFVDDQRVAKISFSRILSLTEKYRPSLGKSLSERRMRAEELMVVLDFN
jgi:hypothetical protein